MFEGGFQAWVHGPLLLTVHDRFKHSHHRFSQVTTQWLSKKFDPSIVPSLAREHLDEIIEAYGSFTNIELEDIIRDEWPWIEARGDLSAASSCATEIREDTMASFYRSLLRQE